MFRVFKITFLLIIMLSSAALSAQVDPSTLFTQKSFVQLLIQRFGWAKGLPGEASDRDYLQLLSGIRTFKYEAESAFNANTDRVTVRNFNLYGPFTGKGWLLGVSESVDANLSIHLPVGGEYLLKSVIKGNGFIWSVGDKIFNVDSKSDNFQEIVVGRLSLEAGKVSIRVSIPPEGALDSLTLSAPDRNPIQPLSGWRFKEPLTALQLAEVVLSITGGYEKLSSLRGENHKTILVADSLFQSTNVLPTTSMEFGNFISSKWLRSDFRVGTVRIPVQISETGYFEVYANLMGGSITGDVNGYPFTVNSRPFLEKTRLGLFRMESGDNFISFNLPPMAGIDSVSIIPKDTKSDGILGVSGVNGPPERKVSLPDAEVVLKSIVESKVADR